MLGDSGNKVSQKGIPVQIEGRKKKAYPLWDCWGPTWNLR